MEKNYLRTQKKRTERSRRQAIGIDVLPDEVLLEIFDFYMVLSILSGYGTRTSIEAWQTLVHACQRWRYLVLGSPRRLNLRLLCGHRTPTRNKLDVWPALPLTVDAGHIMASSSGTDNIIAALGHSSRVRKVNLCVGRWEQVLATMQVPFPELTDLQLRFSPFEEMRPRVIPDSFLGGSAPRLQHFDLDGIPFPGLTKLLLTATHLVELRLSFFTHSGYISPKAMAALLSALSSLRIFDLLACQFRPPSDWESRSLPLPERSILPALRKLGLQGLTKYFEDLVIRIDTPQLDEMHVILCNQIDCPQLVQFINRSPTLSACDKAHVQFNNRNPSVVLLSQSRTLKIEIPGIERDWLLSLIRQICDTSLHPLSVVEDLYIADGYSPLVWENDAVENTLWLQLFLPFTAVKNLYLSREYAPGIAAALQELVGDTVTGVLPDLQNIFVEEPSGPLQEAIGQFVAARRLSDRPVAISFWDEDSYVQPM